MFKRQESRFWSLDLLFGALGKQESVWTSDFGTNTSVSWRNAGTSTEFIFVLERRESNIHGVLYFRNHTLEPSSYLNGVERRPTAFAFVGLLLTDLKRSWWHKQEVHSSFTNSKSRDSGALSEHLLVGALNDLLFQGLEGLSKPDAFCFNEESDKLWP